MTRPYSLDLRRRVVAAVDAGSSCYAVAARFAVSVNFVIKLLQRWRRTGSIEPDRYAGWKRSTVLVHAEVRALLEAEPDLTLGELQVRLAADGVRSAWRRSTGSSPPMGTFSLGHWLVVIVVVLIMFGAGRLPKAMGDLARGLRAFRSGLQDEQSAFASAAPQSPSASDRVRG